VSDPVAGQPGISRAVVGATLATAAGATPAVLGFTDNAVPIGALYGLGWPAFGIAAVLLLDRDPGSRPGRVLAALAAGPAALIALVILVGALATESPTWSRVELWWVWLGPAPIVAALAVIGWSLDIAADRMSRRRIFWLVAWSSVLVAAVLAASFGAGPRAAAAVTTLGLCGTAGLVFRLATTRELPPIDEPLVDAAVAIAPVLFGAGVGTAVRILGLRAGIPGPELSSAFAAVVSAVLVLPAGLWLRRRFLDRRYGPGILSAADVASITNDLHLKTDPRELLGKAAAMVAAASGHRHVSLVLGPEPPEVLARFVLYPLVVGGNRVGTVVLDPRHPEGPEPRQERIVRQLLPTVALVAKAVSLAVEADHARRDLARERDAERARILGDLHDGLGPMLVGMSMRVRAEVRRHPTPLLEALASELADCRGDLRRIVSGLTPSVLDNGDLTTALERLVGAFAGQGPSVTLDTGLDEELSAEVAVAVYRSVAEGLTNALRHARAERVGVHVRTSPPGRVLVDVFDDGVGGPIAPGVGLSSLRRRAKELGGSLDVACAESGTRLHLELPITKAAA
jgi:signal transduction histidine kinase